MRQARDGHYYIHNQFVNHYSARGDAMWNEANGRGAAEPADEPTAEDVWAAPACASSRTSSRCPLTPPAFDPAARGVPGDWSDAAGHTLWWGKVARRHFQHYSSSGAATTPPKVDVGVVLRFLEMRSGPDGLPVSSRLGPPQEREDGWMRLVWHKLRDQERLRLEENGWERAWHGCKFEALYSILYHGKLVESADKTQGDRFLDGAPGVYVHKDGTSRKAVNHTRYTPLCDNGVFWAAICEVLVDREHHRVQTKRKTDQWVQRGCGVRLVALWLCGRTAKDMQDNVPVAKRWAPELEANPRGAS